MKKQAPALLNCVVVFWLTLVGTPAWAGNDGFFQLGVSYRYLRCPASMTSPVAYVYVQNTGTEDLQWQAIARTPEDLDLNWLRVSPDSGILAPYTGVSVAIWMEGGALAAGRYAGRLIFQGNAQNRPEVQIDAEVVRENRINIWPTDVSLNANAGDPATPGTTRLTNLGPDPLPFRAVVAASDQTWLIVSPASGVLGNNLYVNDFTNLSVSVDTSLLNTGAYRAVITVTAPNLRTNSPGVTNINVYLTVPALADAIAITSTTPAAGSMLDSGSTTTLVAQVACRLRSRSNADLCLQVYDANGLLCGSSDTVRVVSTMPLSTYTLEIPIAGGLPFVVPTDSSQLLLKAVMKEVPSGAVFKESRSLSFGVQARSECAIDYGYDLPDVGFTPLFASELPLSYRENAHLDQGACVRVRYSLIQPDGGLLVLRLIEKRHDGKGYQETVLLRKQVSAGANQELLAFLGDRRIPGDKDFWELRATLTPVDTPDILSNAVILPIHRVWLGRDSYSPANASRLLLDTEVDFHFKIEYNNALGSSVDVRAKVDVLGVSRDFGWVTLGNNLVSKVTAGEHGSVVYDTSIAIPYDARTLRFTFEIGSGEEISFCTLYYPFFGYREVTIPPGGGQIVQIPQGKIETIANSSDRVCRSTIDRNTIHDFFGVVSTFLPVGPAFVRPMSTSFVGSGSYRRELLAVQSTWGFDPPIPPDGSFSADLTLNYNLDQLPDNPGFNEARLQVFSLDPVTGNIEIYPTMLDVSNRTATARVNGLSSCYSLGDFGPFTSSVINVPLPFDVHGSQRRIILVNGHTNAAAVTFNAYDFNGAAITNSMTSALPGRQQMDRAAAEIFDLNSTPVTAWVQIYGDRRPLAGAAVLEDAQHFDLLSLPSPEAPLVVLADVIWDANANTRLHIANPSPADNFTRLALFDTNGALVQTYETTLAPKGKLTAMVDQLFGLTNQPFYGYVVALGANVLSAAAVQEGDAWLAAFPGQVIDANRREVTTLVAPRVATGGPVWRSHLRLINLTTNEAAVGMRLINADGTDAATPQGFKLPPGLQYRAELGQVFGLSSPAHCSLVVTSSVGGVVGLVSFADASEAVFQAVLPLQTVPARSVAFAYLDNGSGRFTELSVVNPNSVVLSNLTVRAYQPDGTLVGSWTQTLPAGGQTIQLLASIIPACAGLSKGYFTVDASEPVFAAALFADNGLTNVAVLSPMDFTPATGAPAGPSIEVLPQGLSFGAPNVGDASERLLVIANRGQAMLRIHSLILTNPLFSVLAPVLPLEVPPGGHSTLTVRLNGNSPLSQTGSILFASTDAARPVVPVELRSSGGKLLLDLRRQDNNLLLQWQTSAPNFRLEFAPDLSGSTWSNWPDISVVSNQFRVIITPTVPRQFFRATQ